LSKSRTDLIVFAIGGNALIRSGEKGTFEEQYRNVQIAVRQIVDLIKGDNSIVLTHGNGPQVGATLVRHSLANEYYPALPLHVCTAETQGFIGYMIEQALQDELDRSNLNKRVTTLLTRVIVDKNDDAFQNPTKPIGETFDDEMTDVLLRNEIVQLRKRRISADGTKYKLLVPSPKPIAITNHEAIRSLLDAGFVVVACGGGGIPVMKQNKSTVGADAVIDKDLASEKLATSIGASKLVLLTNVDGIYQNYGERNQELIRTVKVGTNFERALALQDLESGNIAPKVQASISFIRNGGKEAIVCSLHHIAQALAGISGTHFFR
jgi:carbamate kinase